MIEVIVEYRQRNIRNKNNDYFIYPYFLVKGHANNGTSTECIKVCAGVSACVMGLLRLINEQEYSVKYKSGLFEIKLSAGKASDTTYVDEDTNYALNTLLCQLFDLYKNYPSQFSKFEMINVKENENTNYGEKSNNSNTKTKQRPKPFRELKKERLGFRGY